MLLFPGRGPSLYQCVTGFDDRLNPLNGIEMSPMILSENFDFCRTVQLMEVSNRIKGLKEKREGGREGRNEGERDREREGGRERERGGGEEGRGGRKERGRVGEREELKEGREGEKVG